jgi:hypothetical protein
LIFVGEVPLRRCSKIEGGQICCTSSREGVTCDFVSS